MAMAKIKKGDTVVLLVGPKEQRGRTGEVLKVLPKENKVVVSGLKLAKRHRKPTQQNPEGGIDTFEAPIHISNVALADPKTGKATRVKIAADKDGKKSRVAVKSGETISG